MIAKIKELLICLHAGRVTLSYPFEAAKVPAKFRGHPAIDGDKCLGCGACAEVCPPRLIQVVDKGTERRIVLNYSRCTYCARCQEVCPTGAITCTEEFETATADRASLSISVGLKMVRCRSCGKPFMTQRMLKKMFTEYNPLSQDNALKDSVWFWYCPNCRQEHTCTAMERSIKHD